MDKKKHPNASSSGGDCKPPSADNKIFLSRISRVIPCLTFRDRVDVSILAKKVSCLSSRSPEDGGLFYRITDTQEFNQIFEYHLIQKNVRELILTPLISRFCQITVNKIK